MKYVVEVYNIKTMKKHTSSRPLNLKVARGVCKEFKEMGYMATITEEEFATTRIEDEIEDLKLDIIEAMNPIGQVLEEVEERFKKFTDEMNKFVSQFSMKEAASDQRELYYN
tara:strand:+ start:377 stop:712 length:336 start_codon:yes stop_codon:yes gene_type:complete